MFRNILLGTFLLSFSGCAAMCDSSMDCHFNAYGGVRDRIDRTRGRVGSQFDPAAAEEAPPRDPEVLEEMPEEVPVPETTPTDPGNLTEDLLDALGPDNLPDVDTLDPDRT